MLKETLNLNQPKEKEPFLDISERSALTETEATEQRLTPEKQERKQRLEDFLESLNFIDIILEKTREKAKSKTQQEVRSLDKLDVPISSLEEGNLDEELIEKVRKTIETLETKLAVNKFISEDLSDADIEMIVKDLYIPLYKKDFLGNTHLEENINKFIEIAGLNIVDTKTGIDKDTLSGMKKNSIAIESSEIHGLSPKKLKEVVMAIKKFCEQEKDEDITPTTVLAWVEPRISIKRGDEIKIVNDGIPVYTRIEKKADILRSLEHNFGSLVSES